MHPARKSFATSRKLPSSPSGSWPSRRKPLSEDYGIIEVPAPKTWQDKSLIELNVRAKLGVNILAVKRDGDITVSPTADFRIALNDVLVVLGDTAALKAVQKL